MKEITHSFLDGKAKRLLIGGQWVEAQSGRTIDSINPATGKVIAQISDGAEADVDRAVDAAVEPVQAVRPAGIDAQDRRHGRAAFR